MSHEILPKTTVVTHGRVCAARGRGLRPLARGHWRTKPDFELLDSRQLLTVAFTGDVFSDFPEGQAGIIVSRPDPNDPAYAVAMPEPLIEEFVLVSGFNLSGIRLNYDPVADVLSVGLEQPLNQKTQDQRVIIGDADNDLNGGTVDPRVLDRVPPGYIDFPRLGGSETAGFEFDFDNDGVFDVVAGVDQAQFTADPDAAKTLEVAVWQQRTDQNSRFGASRQQFAGELFIGTTPANPGFELSINNFSQLYLQETGQALTNNTRIHIAAFAGSANDGGASESQIPPLPVVLLPAAQLSGCVYVDADNDGVKDPGELPIPGTTITLTRPDGTVVSTTTTGADGCYQFTNLQPGTYCVVETQPANFLDGKDTPGSLGGTTLNNDQICDIVLVGGSNSINNNFGELPQAPPPPPLAQLSGFVYVDADNDGIRDPGELPIPGTTVTLTSPNGSVLGTATTDANGFYQFTNLQPGTYCVVETQPANFLDGKDTPGSLGGTTLNNDQICDITLVAGSNSINNNFGELPQAPPPPPLAQLSGFVYVDADNDGIRDPGELPIPGTTVTLTSPNGSVLGTATTDANGFYQFTNLQPGTYCVVETQPANFLDGKDTPGSLGGTTPANDQICDITLVAGSNSINNNFGELPQAPPPPPLAQLSGFVYVDADNDGIRDPGELPIPGTTVTLTSPNGSVLGTATTDANGFYQFTNLQPGTYCVVETQPANFLDGKDTPGSLGGTTPANDQICDITLVAGSNSINNNFGELPQAPPPPPLAQLSGFVYVDADNDGIRDPGELPIPGTTVTLTSPNGSVLGTAITDANGFYQFTNLQPGTYCVVETQPANFLDGKDTPGSLGGTTPANDQICDITLVAGSNSINNNFGELPQAPPPPPLAQLSGFVYVDADNDGIRDPGELPIPGTTVTLTSPNGSVLGTAITDANGFYQFTNLQPGTYCVVETQPSGFVDGKDTPGSLGGTTPANDQICDITLIAGSNSINNNFGELPRIPDALASLSGCVYVDLNNNGIKEPGEAPIPGTTVTLTRPDGSVVATTTTGADGCYTFPNLTPGTYCVVETQPASFLDGKDTPGSNGGTVPANDQICDITLASGDNAINYNFGELLRPANPRILINPHDLGHINTFRNTLIRVNIFGSATFDASQIDASSVRLGGASPTWMLLHRVNDDRFPDLLLVFRSQDLNLPRGPQDVSVSGMLRNGTPFQGMVRVYNQPIFFPNNGASNPPAGVLPVAQANALANTVAVATAQVQPNAQAQPAAPIQKVNSLANGNRNGNGNALPKANPRISAPILSPSSKLAQLKATRSGVKAV